MQPAPPRVGQRRRVGEVRDPAVHVAAPRRRRRRPPSPGQVAAQAGHLAPARQRPRVGGDGRGRRLVARRAACGRTRRRRGRRRWRPRSGRAARGAARAASASGATCTRELVHEPRARGRRSASNAVGARSRARARATAAARAPGPAPGSRRAAAPRPATARRPRWGSRGRARPARSRGRRRPVRTSERPGPQRDPQRRLHERRRRRLDASQVGHRRAYGAYSWPLAARSA